MNFDRRSLLQGSAALAAAGIFGLDGASDAFAKAPMQAGQSPGFYRLKVGDIEVTALIDGSLDIAPAMFPKAGKPEAERLLEAAGRPKTGAPTAINAFIINTGGKLILLDTGAGMFFGPEAGLLENNIKASGYDPAAIDIVLLTHMHPDHIGGMVGAGGKPVFANAEMQVGEADLKFWTDEGQLSRAPGDAKKFFQFAQAVAAAYKGRVRPFGDGFEPAPGLTMVAAHGHTPGHSMARISAGKDQLLIWGDIVHVAALQFSHPDWAISFDVDQDMAVATRKKVFDETAADNIVVAGAHLDFPGLGRVSRKGDAFFYHPVFWTPRL
jgi:glyoxylase-like metal-dependent hydrolase (beta-lactamase superfamily II)